MALGCANAQTGMCTRGDKCPYAHNVFEFWLHPTRYRSQLCNDGPKCRRRVCFFAHTIDQLRVPPSKPFVAPDMLSNNAAAPAAAPAADPKPMETGAPAPEARSLRHAGALQDVRMCAGLCRAAGVAPPASLSEHVHCLRRAKG